MSERNLEKAVLIAEKHFMKYDNRNINNWELIIGRNNSYKLYAFPGPEAATSGRAEHLPYHTHIYSPSNKKGIRVNLENLELMGGGKISPKNLRNYLKENQEELLAKTKDIFHTGKLKDSYDQG